MRLLRLLTAFVALAALSGCAVSRTYRWQEEVLLHDGRVIVVERSVRTGEVPVELGQPPGESDYTITFTTPDGKRVTWESGKSFWPMILDFFDGAAYVVAGGSTGPDYEKHGCPKPPYFFFRYEAGEWKRIDYEQFPKEIRKANLLSSATQGGERRAGVQRGKTTVDDVKQSHQWLHRDDREVREDKPMPPNCIARQRQDR